MQVKSVYPIEMAKSISPFLEIPRNVDFLSSIGKSLFRNSDYTIVEEEVESVEQQANKSRIVIVENALPIRTNPEPNQEASEANSKVVDWIKKQCRDTDNRYALQMSVAFTIAAVLVMLDPVSSVFPNTFWIGKE